MPRPAVIGTGLALAAAVGAGFANVAGKAAANLGASALAVIAGAYGLAAVLLARDLVRFRVRSREDLPSLIGSAACGVVLAPAALFAGFARTSAVTASLLVNLETLFTAILAAAFLHERVRGREGLSLAAVAAGGVVVAIGPDLARGETPDLGALAGPGLVALAALAWSVDSTLNTRLLARYEARPLLAAKIAAGALALPLVAFAIDGVAWPALRVWPYVAFVAVSGVALSMVCFFGALRRVGATRTIVLFSTAGLWGALAARVALGEALTWPHVAGAALMMLGVIAFAREAGREEARPLTGASASERAS